MYKDEWLFNYLYEEYESPKDLESALKTIKSLYITISEIGAYLANLHEIIPLRYKKQFPKPGENPFFGKNMFEIPKDPKELQAAKERMESLLKANS